eukprot:m.55141 g.55141  ORF g.55141 m.55141 type:complete len:97 (+) comp48837_c0_seq1:95-385(+)
METHTNAQPQGSWSILESDLARRRRLRARSSRSSLDSVGRPSEAAVSPVFASPSQGDILPAPVAISAPMAPSSPAMRPIARRSRLLSVDPARSSLV